MVGKEEIARAWRVSPERPKRGALAKYLRSFPETLSLGEDWQIAPKRSIRGSGQAGSAPPISGDKRKRDSKSCVVRASDIWGPFFLSVKSRFFLGLWGRILRPGLPRGGKTIWSGEASPLRPKEVLAAGDEPCVSFHFGSGDPAWVASANSHRNRPRIDHADHDVPTGSVPVG